jgi:hypothetical protein
VNFNKEIDNCLAKFQTFTEILKRLKMNRATIPYRLEELTKEELIKNERPPKRYSFFSWQNVPKMLMATLSYALGFATSILILNWTNLNVIFRENPLIFWLISVFLSLLGLYFSSKSRRKNI